jgi:hypothetical protein
MCPPSFTVNLRPFVSMHPRTAKPSYAQVLQSPRSQAPSPQSRQDSWARCDRWKSWRRKKPAENQRLFSLKKTWEAMKQPVCARAAREALDLRENLQKSAVTGEMLRQCMKCMALAVSLLQLIRDSALWPSLMTRFQMADEQKC